MRCEVHQFVQRHIQFWCQQNTTISLSEQVCRSLEHAAARKGRALDDGVVLQKKACSKKFYSDTTKTRHWYMIDGECKNETQLNKIVCRGIVQVLLSYNYYYEQEKTQWTIKHYIRRNQKTRRLANGVVQNIVGSIILQAFCSIFATWKIPNGRARDARYNFHHNRSCS